MIISRSCSPHRSSNAYKPGNRAALIGADDMEATEFIWILMYSASRYGACLPKAFVKPDVEVVAAVEEPALALDAPFCFCVIAASRRARLRADDSLRGAAAVRRGKGSWRREILECF